MPLPFDHEAEAAVIGSILIDGEAIYRVAPLLKPEDFHRARHRYCYAACLELLGQRESIDQITVARALARQGILEQVGGLSYLGQLISSTPTSVNVEHYAAIVSQTAALRRIIDTGNAIAEMAFKQQPVDEILQQAMTLIAGARPSQDRYGLRPLAEQYDQLIQEQFDPDQTSPTSAMWTGYRDLDRLMDGMNRSDLIIVGAPTSTGKTSFVLNAVTHAALQGAACAIFSLEMDAHQIATRMLAAHSGIELFRIRNGLYTEQEQNSLIDAVGVLSDLTIRLDENPDQTTQQIRTQAQRMSYEHGLDLVVIDYIQLIRGTTRRYGDPPRPENRVQEMTAISRDLKAMARDLDVPVLACSQLNRAADQRANRRPQLSDLRDSGSIEQDADVVMLLYREDRHTTEEEWHRQNPGQRYPRQVVDINVAKHRNGPTGTIQLCFRDPIMRFYNIEHDNEAQTTA